MDSQRFWSNSSPTSPSLDQFRFESTMSQKLKYKSFIARLDNRPIINRNEMNMIYRWYYYREISYKFDENLTFGLYDGLISTGEKGLLIGII